jgi:hypothetical protein
MMLGAGLAWSRTPEPEPETGNRSRSPKPEPEPEPETGAGHRKPEPEPETGAGAGNRSRSPGSPNALAGASLQVYANLPALASPWPTAHRSLPVFNALLTSAIVTTFPGSDRLPAVQMRPLVDQMWNESPAIMRLAMVGSAIAFHFTPLLTIYVPLPAFLLPAGLRDRHAHKLATHPIYLLRQSMLMVKTVGGLAWGADPTIRQRLGMKPYAPDPGRYPPVLSLAAARLRRASLPAVLSLWNHWCFGRRLTGPGICRAALAVKDVRHEPREQPGPPHRFFRRPGTGSGL